MSSESKSESKGGESKTNFMDIVQEFCMSSELEQEFEKFARDHSDVFLQSLDMKEGEEHPMQFHTVYLEYLETFERRIESFIAQQGFTLATFFSEAKDILENSPVFGSQRFFLEALLATTEYEYFYTIMKGEMVQYRRK